MRLKKLIAALSVALPLSFAAAAAHAGSTVMSFEDDDIDFLLTKNAQGQLVPKLSGNFAVGDVLLSVFEMPNYTIGGANAIPAGHEVTGIAAIQIKSIGAGVPGGNGLGTSITFEAYSGGLNSLLPVAHQNVNILGNSAVAMWINSTADFDLKLDFATTPATNCTSRAQCVFEASAGDLLQVDGFAGDMDEFWSALITVSGGTDPSVVAGLNGASGVAQFNAALTTTFNAPGAIVYKNIITGEECPAGTTAADGCIAGPTITGPITGGRGIAAGIRNDGAFARSDIDATKRLLVPEPGTLALAGLSLLALAVGRRRQK